MGVRAETRSGGLGLMLVQPVTGTEFAVIHYMGVCVQSSNFKPLLTRHGLPHDEAQEQRIIPMLCITWTLLTFPHLQLHFQVFVSQAQHPGHFLSLLLLNMGHTFFFTFLIISG